jgi:hypothetical protein
MWASSRGTGIDRAMALTFTSRPWALLLHGEVECYHQQELVDIASVANWFGNRSDEKNPRNNAEFSFLPNFAKLTV